MTRDELEARIWAITGREMTAVEVDAILDAAAQYAAELHPVQPRMVFHGTNLYPVIGLLAELLLGEDAPKVDMLPVPSGETVAAYERTVREAARGDEADAA